MAFSTAPPAQLGAAAALGGANLIGVLYLGSLLASTSAYPLAALGSSAPLIATLRRLYAPLAIYATGFLAIPAGRWDGSGDSRVRGGGGGGGGGVVSFECLRGLSVF